METLEKILFQVDQVVEEQVIQVLLVRQEQLIKDLRVETLQAVVLPDQLEAAVVLVKQVILMVKVLEEMV